jgi:hypothetical protein
MGENINSAIFAHNNHVLHDFGSTSPSNPYSVVSNENVNVGNFKINANKTGRENIETNGRTVSKNCHTIHKMKKKYKRLKAQARIVMLENDRLKLQILELPMTLTN